MTRAFLALTPAVLKSAKYSVENILAGGSGKGCWPYLSLRSTTYYNWALICQKTWRGRDFSDPGGKRNIPTAVSRISGIDSSSMGQTYRAYLLANRINLHKECSQQSWRAFDRISFVFSLSAHPPLTFPNLSRATLLYVYFAISV